MKQLLRWLLKRCMDCGCRLGDEHRRGDSCSRCWDRIAGSALKESLNTCRCNCGYTCGGPGRCTAPMETCLCEHFVRDCDHDFTGELHPVDEDGQGHSVKCSKCGMFAIHHDMMVGP